MRNNYSNYLGVVTSAGASDEHPLSIHSASIRRRWHSRGMQLICTLVLLFTFAIGQMWGADVTFNCYNSNTYWGASSGTVTSKTAASDAYTVAFTKVGSNSNNSLSGSTVDAGYANLQVGNTINISAKSTGFTKVVIIFTEKNRGPAKNDTWSNYFTANTGTLSQTSDTEFEWTGSSSTSLTLSNVNPGSGALAFRVKTIIITPTSGGCSAPTSPSVTASPSNASYTEGDNISLSASATGTTSGTTTYTWYKGAVGDNWATVSATTPIQAASTSGSSYTKNSCATSDTGVYWCNISNGDNCNAQASLAVSVASATPATSWDISFECNGATSGCPSTLTSQTALPNPLPSAPTKTGYSFSGWFINSDLAEGHEAVAGAAISDATTLYAKWTAKTTSLTLNPNTANHGTGSNVNVTATYGSVLPEFSAAVPASMFALEGYYTAATEGTKIINADGSLVAGTAYADADKKWASEETSLELFAQYEDDSYASSPYTITMNSSVRASETTKNGVYLKYVGNGDITDNNGIGFDSNNSKYVHVAINSAMGHITKVIVNLKVGTASNESKGVRYVFDDETKVSTGTAICNFANTNYNNVEFTPSDETKTKFTITRVGTTVYVKSVTVYFVDCTTPTAASISGTTAYTVGENVSLTASATGATSATFTWYKGADWATASAGSSVGTGATLAINSCTTDDAGTYWCNISNGTSCEVQASKAITVASCTKPGTPGTPSVSNKTHNSANLSWTAADNSDGYKVSIIKTDDESVVVDWTDCATNSYAASGLNAETEYTFKVKAVGATGYCDFGSEASVDFTTNADPCHTYFWFSKAADATTAGVTNNENSFFTTSASGTNSAETSITIDGTEYAITNRTGNIGNSDAVIATFTVPANKAGTFYTNMSSSGSSGAGSNRTLTLKKGGVAVITASDAIYGDGDPHNATIENIPAGTYTLHAYNNVKVGMFALKACDATYHTISFDSNGGSSVSDLSALDGVAATKPADPTKANNIFAGWYNGENAYVWSTAVTTDLALTAHWTPTYAVTYAAGDGTGEMTDSNSPYVEGAEVTLLANTFTAPTNKEFDAWVVTKTASGDPISVSNGKFTMPAEAVTVTATWKFLPKLTLTAGEGATGDDVVSYHAAGTEISVPAKPEGFSKGTDEFTGWAYSPSVSVEAGKFNMPSSDLTLTAQWASAAAVAQIVGGDSYGTFADAIAAVDDGQTIKLLADCSFADKWTITGKTVTLDMNGNNLAGPAGGDGVEVGDGGKLILTDGSVMEDPAINGSNEITYAGGKLTGKWPINVVAGGEFEMNGGWIVGGEAAVWVGYTGVVTINNGVLEAMDNAVVMAPGNAGKGGYTINVHGGILLGHIQTAGYASMVIYHPNVGTLNIDGGKLISTNGPAVVIRGGDSNITGGEIVAQGTGTGKCGDASQLLGAVGIAADFKSAYPGVANTDVAISGTINVIAAADEAVQAIYADATPTSAEVAAVAVSGGTFNRELTQEVCAENYAPEDNGDGTYGVKPLAVTFDIEAYVVSTAEPTLQQVKDSLTAVGYTYSNIAAVDRGHTHNNIYDGIKWSNSNDGYIQFETAAGKLVIVKTGYMKSNTAAKMSVNGVEDATVIESADETKETHKLYYWYNAGATLYKLDIKSKTAEGTCVLKAITITDPYQVSFNTHGGDPVAPQTFYGTALTLPSATNGTQIFKGWYDADTEGNLIGKAGDSYTPTASITLHAQWETVSSDNTLSALEVDNVALADFDPDKHIYNIVCEYGHTPQITLATATAEAQGATVTIVNTPVDGDGYKYIQANVIPASGTPIGYNQVRYTNLPKKGVSLIKVTIPNGTGNTQTIEEANITGYIGGTATQKLESGKHKLGSGGHFIGMTLAEGTFQENDLVIVNVEEIKTDLMRVFKENTAAEDNVVASSTANMTVGDNYVTLGATTTNSLYLRRGTNDENYQTGWNPFIGSFEVQRYMDPFIEEFELAGVAGTIDQDLKTIAIELPYGTSLSGVAATVEAYANGGATVDAPAELAYNTPLVYTVSSAYAEDGDVDYTVTISEAEASHDATLSDIKLNGVSLAGFSASTLSYDVELAKGTTAYPTVTYTAATGATVATDIADFPGDYKLVVTAQDGTTKQTYTIHFTVSTVDKVVIFDGSNMTAVATSPDATTGLAWQLVSDGDKYAVAEKTITGYTHAIATGGNSADTRHLRIDVPADYQAQFVIAQATNKDGTERKGFITTAATPNFANALFTVANSVAATATEATSTTLAGNTSYYLHCDASINFVKVVVNMIETAKTPAITAQPADLAVCALGTDALSVTVAEPTDGGTLSYQWYKEAGETDQTVGTNAASYIPTAEGEYYVVVTNTVTGKPSSSTKSATAAVTQKTATAITTAPANQRGAVGAQVTLSVTAAGEGLSYAWYTCDNEAGENPVALEPAVTAASLQVTITENMNQWYKVVVSGDCGTESATALVEEWSEVEQANVTGSMIWDWTKSCWDEHSNVQLPDDKINVDTLMANTGTSIVNNSEFRSDMLVIRGQYAWREENSKRYFQGFGVKFHATVPGMVKVTYRGTGNSRNVILSIGDYTAPEYAGDYTTVQAVVPAGDVVITGIGGTGNANGMVRINKIEFDANLSSYEFSANPFGGYERPEVTPGVYGTICLPNGGVMTGASIFEVAYMTYENNNPYKVFFDEVLNGTMVAGRPYIFIPNEDVTAIRVYYTDAANASAGDYRGLHGTFDHMNGDDLYGKYIFYNNMIFESKNSQNWLDENRAYIVLSDVPDYITPVNPSSRRIALGVNGTNTATGFENAAADEAPVKMMIDGKLFILRGEKMYDATGKLVK